MAMDEIALVLVVHERPGISATGEPPSAIRRLRNRLMFFPILKYDDGYGWTYGGQTAVVDALGKGTRLSFPLSWGGTKRAAIEADRTFKTGPLTRLTGTFGISERENPHYEIDDQRTLLNARAERRLFTMLTVGGDLGRTQMDYFPLHESFWSAGADATVDTRRDPIVPVGRRARDRRLEPAESDRRHVVRRQLGRSLPRRCARLQAADSARACSRSVPSTTPRRRRCRSTSSGCSAGPTCAASTPAPTSATSASSGPRSCACRSRRR